jgi:hypothetical protein
MALCVLYTACSPPGVGETRLGVLDHMVRSSSGVLLRWSLLDSSIEGASLPSRSRLPLPAPAPLAGLGSSDACGLVRPGQAAWRIRPKRAQRESWVTLLPPCAGAGSGGSGVTWSMSPWPFRTDAAFLCIRCQCRHRTPAQQGAQQAAGSAPSAMVR